MILLYLHFSSEPVELKFRVVKYLIKDYKARLAELATSKNNTRIKYRSHLERKRL